MVFESIVADILNRYLGEYVENLDKNQLKIGIWGGDVVLKNLVLKQSALSELDLPVQTVYGHLGSLILKIPWKNLYNAPVEAYIDRLYLLAVPNSSVRYNAEREDKTAFEAKKAELERIQLAKKMELERNKPKEDKTFAEKLSAQIINNVQIKIGDIHIRYEDNVSTSEPFAFGITLSKFSVHTTDFNWTKCPVAQSLTEIYKVAQLESLAIYMNCESKLFQEYSQDNYLAMFKETIASRATRPSDYDFILGPITSEAKLKMHPDPGANEIPFSIPKIILSLTMEKLAIGLTKAQYQDMMQLIEQFGRMSRAYPYRQYRPHGITYRGHYKEWWHFAFRCVLETDIRRKKKNWSWDNMLETRKTCKLYEVLYKQKLTTKKPTQQLLDQVEECEKKLNIQNLVIIRQKIELEIEKMTKEKEVEVQKGWFGGWWSGKKDDPKDTDGADLKKKFQAAMNAEEKEKLFKAIGYQESDTPTELPQNYIATKLQFELNCFEISIKSNIESENSIENVMLLRLNEVKCAISQRPSAQSIKLNLNMRELLVYGLQQKQYLPVMIKSEVKSSESLLDVMFESNPIDKACDQRVKVTSQPIQIVYNGETVIQLLKVFQTPKTATLSQLQDVAAEKLVGIKERSATGLQYAIQTQPRLEVDIALMPSYFLIPKYGKYTNNESVIVVSLGKLLIRTEPRAIAQKSVQSMYQQGANADQILQELISQSYDKFQFEIQDIQVLVANSSENWEQAIAIGRGTKMHILEPTIVKINAQLSVIADDPRLPKMKISCELPSINISVTEHRVLDILLILTSLPLPESDEEIVVKPLTKEGNILGSSLSLLKFLDEKQHMLTKRKDQPKENIDVTDDVVQFTDLEAYFLLSEISITICKSDFSSSSASNSSSDEFETPTEDFPSESSKVLGTIAPSFKSVAFETPAVLEAPAPHVEEKMLCVKVKRLEMKMTQQTYELKVDLKLGAVSFDQYRLKNNVESVLNVINTPRYDSNFDYLFTLNYTNCKKTSPEFTTKHQSVEQLISINMSTVVLQLNQDGITELIEIANALQFRVDLILNAHGAKKSQPADRIADAAPSTFLEVAREKLPMILEEEGDESSTLATKGTRGKRSKIVDSIKLKVKAKMEDVTVQLENDVRSIAALEVKNLTSGILMKTSYTEVNIKLEDIIVTDLNPNTIHTKILSIIGGDAMTVQVIMFNVEETADYNSDNMKIDVKMGCAKIIFMNWFVTSVLNFLDNFQTAQERIKEASKAAAEAAKQNVVAAYEQATRIKMNIKIKAPIILVPVHSKSLEAIVVDLGNLTITNLINNLDVKSERGPAVIDEMKVELSDVKLSKVLLFPQNHNINQSIASRFGSCELNYEINPQDYVLKPTSFALIIKRNLSSGWYKDHPTIEISGRLKSIELNVIAQDYKVIMEILEKNMSEGQNEFKKPKPRPVAVVVPENNRAKRQWNKAQVQVLESKKPFGLDMSSFKVSPTNEKVFIEVAMKFTFQIDSIIINLYSFPNEGLARFGLYYLSLNGQNLADGSMSTALVLCDVHLDDTRPGREGKITRFMERREQDPNSSNLNETVAQGEIPTRSMIDVTFRMKNTDIFADVKVFSFNLILSMDFLLKLSSFLQPPTASTATSVDAIQEAKEIEIKRRKSSVSGLQAQDAPKMITLALHIEEYDVILVEKMDDINCLALIMNNEISAKVRLHGEKQIIQGEINNFSLYLSEFNPQRRNQTKHYVLHPCSINLNGSTPEDMGLHVSLNVSKIKICVSPATIELMNSIMATMTQQESDKLEIEKREPEYEDMWGPKTFDEDEYWFIRVEEAEDALSYMSLALEPAHKEEKCVIEVPSIAIIIENGIGVHTIPMLFIETSMEAQVTNWSSEMGVSSTLRLTMSYYNNMLALWEPLIEPVEMETPQGIMKYTPWELSFDMNVDKHLDDPQQEDPTTFIKIKSEQTLELLVTKTCLDVLQTLGNSFSKAIEKEGLIKAGAVDSPYVLKNDTGLEIQLELAGTEFIFHGANFNSLTKSESVLFENIGLLSSPKIEEITSCIIYPGGKVFLQPKIDTINSFSLLDETIKSISFGAVEDNIAKEKFITLYIPEVKKKLQLPIHRADKRYFPIYRETNQEPWGIISEILVEMGSTFVTIRGIVQIFNHFTVPIYVHRILDNDAVQIGEVLPNECFNVPLNCIHDTFKELHFSIAGYRTSIQSMSWKESPSNHNFVKSLQCDPINTYEPLYINAIRERFDVFFEISSKYTMLSACYVIRLRPPLLLRNALPIDLVVSVAGCSVVRDKDRNREASLDIAEDMTSLHQNTSGIHGEDFLDYGEKLIKPGELLHLPTVKTASKNSDNLMYIVARLVQYLERDWSVKTEIPTNPPEFGVWTLNSYDSVEKTSIQLGVRFENLNNGLTITIYCPFWMLNKTGLMLSYRKSRKTEKNELAGKTTYKPQEENFFGCLDNGLTRYGCCCIYSKQANDENTNVLYHPPEYEGPILFSFREKAFFGKKKAAIRVDSGEWCDRFSLDVAGSSGVVECKANNITYLIGVQNVLTHNSLTKQIIFMPYYVLINRAPFDIEVQEDQRPADPKILIKANDCAPLWPKAECNRMLRAKTVHEDETTAPFKYDDVQCTLLQLKNKYGGINVDVHVTEGVIYITFTEYHPGDAPGLIINFSDEKITFWEKGNVNARVLMPQQSIYYTWVDPAGERIITWQNAGKSNIENDLRRDGVDEFVVPKDEAGGSRRRSSTKSNDSPVFWVSFLDGTQRVLLFTKNPSLASGTQSASRLEQVTRDVEINIHGIGLSLVNNVKMTDIMYIGIASSNVIWEQQKKNRYKQMKIAENLNVEERYQEYLRDLAVNENVNKKYIMDSSGKVELDFAELVMQKHTTQRRIRRTFYPGFWMEMKTSPYQLQLHAKINRIQIDNQLSDCVFPIVLAPIPPPKSVAATTELKPFIEMSVVQRIIPHSKVTQYKYMRVLMQEFHVKVDLGFINEICEMLASEATENEAKKQFEDDLDVQKQPLFAHVTVHSQQEQKNFYDNLHLGPIKVHVSFSMADSESKALPGIISTLLQGVGVTLTDVNDVVFRLAFFEREYQFFTQRQLVSQCTTHYTGQAVKQLYVLVLGLDVIGNPYGLVVGFTKGVEDLFYEPFQGLIQGPGEFAEGLVLGVRSLFGHTVGGAAGAVSKITGAVGKGVAALTFDKDYQKKRRDQMNKRPSTMQEGLARSGKGLVMGVFDGVTGIVTKPISGARSEGVQGFFKGLGKGAVGLVARPAAGVIDFASGTLDSVKRATELSDEEKKLRPSRFLHSDGIVRPYSKQEAEGNKIFKELDKGKFLSSDQFAYFEIIIENKDVLVVTNHRIVYAIKNDLFGGWQSEWIHKWEEIADIRVAERGVEIALEAGKAKSGFSKMFSGSDKTRKVLLINNKRRCEKLVQVMLNLKQKYGK